MLLRALAVLVIALAPIAAHAADEENPFKNAKVGDYARYDTRVKIGGLDVKMVRVQTVTAVDDKQLSLRTVTEVNGKDIPNKRADQKIDLTRPFDPAGADAPAGPGTKWEKAKTGTEKLKIGGKEYDCTWTTYKPIAPNLNVAVEGELKVWLSKDVPFVVRRALALKSGADEIIYTTDLIEFGRK